MALALPTQAMADGGAGGGPTGGGAGGAGTGGATGSSGVTGTVGGGGGGAAGVTGGTGGAGAAGTTGLNSQGGNGGSAGSPAGADGAAGGAVNVSNSTAAVGGGGGGGGGGFLGAGGAGGNGGAGGDATNFIGTGATSAGGGGGGGGGFLNGGRGGSGGDAVAQTGIATAGNGGAGGDSVIGAGGDGGSGGTAVVHGAPLAFGGTGGKGGNGGSAAFFSTPATSLVNTTASSFVAGAGGRGGAGGGAQQLPGDNGIMHGGEGGNGGNGGTAGLFAGPTMSITNSASLSFAGGAGGRGGDGTLGNNAGAGGDGGRGGDAASFVGGSAVVANSGVATFVGGNGGAGGNNGGFGAGGNGGNGIVFAGTSLTLTSSGTMSVSGGTGGGSFRAGGDGGIGILVTGTNTTLTLNNVEVRGGNGGVAPTNGAGGAGIVANGITIDNAGSISGGQAGGGGPQAFAIVLTGGSNAIGGSGDISGGIQLQAGSLMPGLPGSAIGPTLAVGGPVSLLPGSIYNIRINGALSDSITATGAVTVTGASVSSTISGFALGQRDTIITANTINGTFASVSAGNSAFLTPVLTYDATHVYETILGNAANGTGINFGTVAQTQNQLSVANALTNIGNANGFSGALLNFISLLSAPQARAVFTAIDGESATGSQQTTFNAMNQFLGVMTDPFIAGRGDPVSAGGTPTAYAAESLAYAARTQGGFRSERDAYAAIYTKAPAIIPFEQRWSVWAAGFGGTQNTNGDPRVLGSNDTRSSVYGTAVGADFRFSPDTIAGIALAGGGTSFNVNGLGYGRSDLFQAGAFVRHNIGPAYITAALAYGWQDITTDRTLMVAGIDHLRAQFNANAWSGRVESGYRFVVPSVFGGVGITPYAAGQFTTFDLPAYAEAAVTGSPLFGLNYAAKSVTDTRSELGVRTDKSFATQNGIFTLRGRLAWAHDFDPDRSIAATFQSLPGASFVVNGAAQAPNSALTTASAEWKWLNGWSTAATFEGEFSNVTSSYAGKGVLRYAW
jgi:uncharacterized protein with beta-barrel porin domain